MPHLPRPDLTSSRRAVRRFRAACERRTRRVRREVAYLVVTVVLGLVGLGFAVVLALLGPVLAVSVVGLPLVGSGIVLARGMGGLQREVAAQALHREVSAPARADRGSGLLAWTRSALTDRAGWRSLAYLVVHLPVVVASVVVGAAGVGAAALVLDPLVRAVDPPGLLGGSWARTLGLAVGGAVALAVLPWVVRLVVRVDLWLVRSLLGATERDARIEEARVRAVDEAAAVLRRLEEQDPPADPMPATRTLDLRDGVRPVLVAEPLHRSGADGVDDETEHVVDLTRLDHGHRDRGLGQVLAGLAAEVPTATRLHLDLHGTHLPGLIEALAEEAATELMGNVVRHSDADLAELSAVAGAGALTLRVSDDGHGGAQVGEGTGLGRLSALITAVGGQLEISSPPGGPTDITVALPLAGALASPAVAPAAVAAPAVDPVPRTDGRPPRLIHRTDALGTRRLRGIGRPVPRRSVP